MRMARRYIRGGEPHATPFPSKAFDKFKEALDKRAAPELIAHMLAGFAKGNDFENLILYPDPHLQENRTIKQLMDLITGMQQGMREAKGSMDVIMADFLALPEEEKLQEVLENPEKYEQLLALLDRLSGIYDRFECFICRFEREIENSKEECDADG